MEILIKRLNREVHLPEYKTAGAAGCDLCAAIPEPVSIQPKEIKLIPTGIAIEFGDNAYFGLIAARSGLALKHGISLANGIGVIDSDYRGEIMVGLINLSIQPYIINPAERIAQLIFVKIDVPDIKEVDGITTTDRGTGGFGSTGR